MSVNEIQGYLLKYKKYIAMFVAFCLLLCTLYIKVSQSYTAEVYIKYLGEKAESGMAEDGSALNPHEITDALVVKNALDSIGANGNHNAIRKSISVTPVISYAEEAKYSSYIDNFSNYDNTEEEKTHPVYYSVKFTTSKGDKFAKTFLDALVKEYKAYYVEKYAYSNDLTLISENTVMQYDYYETADILKTKIRGNMDYLNDIASSDVDFRSAVTGYSMSDLAAEYGMLLEQELASVSNLIVRNGITKNGAVLKNTLMNRADNATLESNRNADKAETKKQLMEVYSKKNKEYVWNASNREDEHQIRLDAERDWIYSNDKTVYDQMTLDYVSFSISSKNLLIDRDIYLNHIDRFSDASDPNLQVEQLLSEICEKYNTIQQLTEKTLSDYNNYKSARYIASVSGIATSENVSELIYYASTFVLSLGLGIVAVVFLELKRKKKI